MKLKRTPFEEVTVALACALGLAVLAVVLAFDRGFFHIDDKQTGFIPHATDIARGLLGGEWPFLSLSTVFSGNYSLDWQHGLLNPASLLSYLIVYPIDDLDIAGAALSALYLPLLSAGAFLVARQFGLSRATALLFSLIVSTNNFLLYWAASSWHNHLVGTVWFVWSWLFLELARDRRYAVLGLTGATYLVLTSGFPQAGIALLVLIAAYFFGSLGRRKWLHGIGVAIGALAALLLAAPSLLPAVLTLNETTRGTGISNQAFLTPTIGDFLQIGSPAFFPKIYYWGGMDMHVPIFYFAWFLPVLLPFVDYQSARRSLDGMLPAVVALGILLLLGTGPENLGPLRWPFRYLLFVHLLGGMVCFVLLFRRGPLIIDRGRLLVAAGLIGLMSLVGMLEQPTSWQANLYAGVAVAILGGASLVLYRRFDSAGLLTGLFIGSVGIFFATHVVIPRNVDLPDFHVPSARNGIAMPPLSDFSGYRLFLGDRLIHHSGDEGSEFFSAATGLASGKRTFNGYNPLGHNALQTALCLAERTQTMCAEGVRRWAIEDPDTGATLLDLFRITSVDVQKGMWQRELGPRLGPEWRSVYRGNVVESFERVAPIALPGTVSRVPDGVELRPVTMLHHKSETLDIVQNEGGGRLIFARLFWPGYHAMLNGEPIAVVGHLGLLVAVELPSGTIGELRLWFRPPGLRLGFLLAGIGIGILGVFLFALKGMEAPRSR